MSNIRDMVIGEVETLLREADVCEVRLAAEPWYPAGTRVSVRVSLRRRNDPREYTGWSLAEALAWLPEPDPSEPISRKPPEPVFGPLALEDCHKLRALGQKMGDRQAAKFFGLSLQTFANAATGRPVRIPVRTHVLVMLEALELEAAGSAEPGGEGP